MWALGIANVFKGHWQSPCTAKMAGKCLPLGRCKGIVEESNFSEWFYMRGVAHDSEVNIILQDCFLQKEARVCVNNAFVLEDSMFK